MMFDKNFYNGFICKCAEMGLSGESAFNLFQKVAAPPQQPAAKATPYDFGGELKKLLTSLRDEYKANKAAYKINGVDMVQSFARGIRGRVAEIQKNPNGYSDAYKRKLMASYKRKIDGIRARVNGASKATGNASGSGSGWQTLVPGISIKPRSDPRYGDLDRELVRKYNDRFLTSLDKSYTPETPNQTVQTGDMYTGDRYRPYLNDLTPIRYF